MLSILNVFQNNCWCSVRFLKYMVSLIIFTQKLVFFVRFSVSRNEMVCTNTVQSFCPKTTRDFNNVLIYFLWFYSKCSNFNTLWKILEGKCFLWYFFSEQSPISFIFLINAFVKFMSSFHSLWKSETMCNSLQIFPTIFFNFGTCFEARLLLNITHNVQVFV